MSQPVTYAPGQVVVSFLGNILTGFGDEIVKVTPSSEGGFTKVMGADGEVSRRQSADESGEIAVTLKQTSGSNSTLQAIYARDLRRVVPQVGPLLISDNNGNVLWSAEAWIRILPEVTRSKEITDMVWTFDCSTLKMELSELPSVA
jgi:hypothetical protein